MTTESRIGKAISNITGNWDSPVDANSYGHGYKDGIRATVECVALALGLNEVGYKEFVEGCGIPVGESVTGAYTATGRRNWFDQQDKDNAFIDQHLDQGYPYK